MRLVVSIPPVKCHVAGISKERRQGRGLSVTITEGQVGFCLMPGKGSLGAVEVFCPCSPQIRGPVLNVGFVSGEAVAYRKHVTRNGNLGILDRWREEDSSAWPKLGGRTVSAQTERSCIVPCGEAVGIVAVRRKASGFLTTGGMISPRTEPDSVSPVVRVRVQTEPQGSGLDI